MTPTPERRRLGGYALAAVMGIVVLAVVAAYIWSIVNGEATVVTAATAILVFAVGELFTRRRNAQQYRWDKIAPFYESFIRLVRELGQGDDSKRLQVRSAKVLGEFSDKLLLWGSPGVIEAWATTMRLAETDPPTEEMVLAYAKVLLAIRKDLGHGDLMLQARDLLRVTITDIDEHLPPGTRV